MALMLNSGVKNRWFSCSWIVILSVLLCHLTRHGYSFNVDTVNFIRHRGEGGSMFGFSVAEHKEYGKSWVLVGAPEARTRQLGVDHGGAVYKCEITKDDACEQIPFDTTGNNNNSEGRQIDKKSYQWFGATVRSSGENGVVLACAPRYVWFTTTTAFRRDPVGTCYVAKNQFQDFSEFSPCRTRNWGYHRQGSCQAGLGADVSKDGQRLYVGAPGSWYWQGQIYDIDSSFKMPTISPDYSKTQELNLIAYESGNKDGRNKSGSLSNKNNQQTGGGQLYAQNPHKIPEVWATSEGSPQDDDSYLGYSVASGDFDGRGTGGVAVGMPRGASLLGKVVLYTRNLTNMQNITGHQLGSYFSYSVAAIDVDGDALDDLIIGAPLYTDLSNNEGKYETGRVYVYFNEPRYDHEGYFVRFSRWMLLDGTNSKSRFGLSVAALGDINKDGYGDFAVGAPYDGETNRGAVYVYHGMRKGVRENPSQIIKGEELSVPVSTFGFSISGGLDMDGNQYPDMVVGAYESDTAIFFRSRPVVKVVESKVSFHSKNKQISLEDKPCTLRDYTPVSCTNIEACLKYSGPEVSDVLDFDIGIALDSKKTKSPRMYFLDDEGRHVKNDTIRLSKGQSNCKNYYVYIKPNIRDKLTPLEAELRYNVIHRTTSGSGRRYTRSLEPALDTTELNIRKDSISIQKNCGPDNVCIPDLRLTTKKSVSKYLLGSREKFALDVMVENRGEDAFEAVYNLEVPPGMNFVNIERLDSDKSIPVQCSAPSSFTNNTLKCDIGNPLPKGRLVNFKVLLQPFHQEGMKPSYSFVSTVNSTNPEEEFTSTDNSQRFTVPIWVETDLLLSGSSHPAEIHYNMSHYEGNITQESDIGPQVVHIYSIRNKGPADILEAQTIFLWPSYTLAGDHLLYLLEQPETNGNIKCEWVDNVNEERIELDRKRKSYLQSGQAHAAQRVGGNVHYGSSDYKKSMRKGKGGRVSEEERRRLEQEGKIGESFYETGDSSMIHRQRVHQQSRQGGSSGTGGVTISEGTSQSGSWSSGGSGGDRVRYEENYRSGTRGGSTSGGSVHWAEGGMQGRRVGGGGYRVETEGGRHDDYYEINRRDRDRHDDSDWGAPADTDTMRKAYGANEFRTVALDLNSNIPVLNIGSDKTSGEATGQDGSRTRVTYGGSSSEERTEYGSRTYAVNNLGSGGHGGEGRVYVGGEGGAHEGTIATHTVHVGGGTSGTVDSYGRDTYEERTRHEQASTGRRTQDGTIATHTVLVTSGGSSGTVDVHGKDSYEERRRQEQASGGVRTQDGTIATHTLHVSGGSSRTGGSGIYEIHGTGHEERSGHESGTSGQDVNRIYEVTTGSYGTEEGRTSQGGSRTYEVHGGRYDAEHERRQETETGGSRTQQGTSRTQTVHVTHDGSRTYEIHGGGYDADHERRQEAGSSGSRTQQGTSRTQTVHVTHDGSRTYEIHGGSYDADYERRRQEMEARRTQEGSHDGTTRTYDSEYERRRQEMEARRTQEGSHDGTTRTYDRDSYDRDYERRRQEMEARRTQEGSHDGTTRTYDSEYERRRQEMEARRTQDGSYDTVTRTYDRDSYDREYERRRQEAEAGVSHGGSVTHVSQGGSSRTYVTQGGSSRTYEHDGDNDRRYEDEERERGGVEGTRHYSTEYSYRYNVSSGSDGDYDQGRNRSGYFIWENVSSGRGAEYDRRLQEDIERRLREQADRELQEIIRKSGGGRIVDGGSSKWIVFDNGTIITAGSTQNPEYEKRVREEFQRRVQQQLEREREERLRNAGSTGSYDQEYERRRVEAEAEERARGGAGSTHHYSTEYSYHYNTSSHGGDSGGRFGWDGHITEYQRRIEEDLKRRMRGKSLQELDEMLRNTGGRVVEGGSSRWVVFDNGTIVSVGAKDNPEYERRLREEFHSRWKPQMEREREERLRKAGAEGRSTHWYSYNRSSEFVHDPEYQRRLEEEWNKRGQEGGSHYGTTQEHYYNRSYETRYTRHDKRYDPDLGYEVPDNDLHGEKTLIRSSRTRSRTSLNSLENEESEKESAKGGRSKREHLIPRFKRLVEEGVDLKSTLKCGPTDCTKIMCTVGPLSRGQEAWVAFRGRVWAQTLKKLGQDRVIRLSSLQASQLTKLPHIGEPESAKVETQEVFTEIMPQDTVLKPEVAPLWIWVLSACAGTLILLLLIFLLWKLGFFKRNRPSSAPEKQPLNRNGYQAGDEAL